MPSKSPAQARLMAAIAHGWKPPKSSGISVPMSVAKDFFNADHPRKKMAKGGLASAKFNEPKQNEHVVSVTQDKPIGHGTGLNDLKRAIQNWGPEILGFGGDIMDVAGNIIQRAQGKRGPNIRPGEFGNSARRRFATAERTPNAQTVIEEPSEPSLLSTLGNVANPFLFMSPSKLAGLTQQYPHLASVIAASHGMDMPFGALGVIKERGGNWLNRELTDYLSPLKVSGTLGAHGPEDLAAMTGISLDEARASWNSDPANASKTAINRWIEGPLTKYTKTHLGTPEDPLLKLADEGVSHLNMQQLLNPDDWIRRTASAHRKHSNLPQPSLGGYAQGWSDLADALVRPQEAESLTHVFGKYYPDIVEREGEWLNKIDPKSRVYSFEGDESPWHLGYDHLIDELKSAISHDSDLPEHLRLKPEDLTQMGMEKAVRHVDAINKWREASKAEANLALSKNRAVHVVKEYPDNNPKGLHWVELKRADLPKGWTSKFDEDSRIWRGYDAEGKVIPELGAGQSPEEVLSSYTYEDLEKALKYEGDQMRHCVGGYCDDVSDGISRIFSLRDAKGEPHVTIETQPSNDWKNDLFEASRRGNAIDEMFGDRASEIRKAFNESPFNNIQQFLEKNPEYLPQKQNIIQIKGKQNKRPNDEYVPFIQDFIKSGKWDDILDLHNAQMWKHPKTGQYHTKAEAESDPILSEVYESRNLDDRGNYVGGYAEGGLVKKYPPNFFDDLNVFLGLDPH